MKTKGKTKKVVFAMAVVLIAALTSGAVVSAGGGLSMPLLYATDDAQKGEVYISHTGVADSKKYKKQFKKAKWVIVYKKTEKSKKFKRFKKVKRDQVISDKKLKGLVQYKFQPVTKKGKKGKKTNAFSIFALRSTGKYQTKDAEKGTIISFKIKNTSTKYKMTLSTRKDTDAYVDGDEIKKPYITNNSGTKKVKKFVVKKGKTATVNIMFPGLKLEEGKRIRGFSVGVFNLKAGKKVFVCDFEVPSDEKKPYTSSWNEKELIKLYK